MHRRFQEVIEVIETFEAEMDALTWEVPSAAPLLELKEWNVPAPSKARETEACYSHKSCDRSSGLSASNCSLWGFGDSKDFKGTWRYKKSESRMKGAFNSVETCSTLLLFF